MRSRRNSLRMGGSAFKRISGDGAVKVFRSESGFAECNGLAEVPSAGILLLKGGHGEEDLADVLKPLGGGGGVVPDDVGEFVLESSFAPGQVLFQAVPAEKLGDSGDGGVEAGLAEPLDGLGEAAGAGKVSDLGLAILREGFESGVGTGFGQSIGGHKR